LDDLQKRQLTSLLRYLIVNELVAAEAAGPREKARGGEIFVELTGIEPVTSGLQSQRSPN
jgi:hypothetical protein